MKVHVTIRSSRRQVHTEAETGERLLTLLQREGFSVPAACGGRGKCGKCLVTLCDEAASRRVPACRTEVSGDCLILADELEGGAILGTDGAEDLPASGEAGLGAALDLGTTTVALELCSLADGRVLGRAAAWNAQAPYGADVISRAQFAARQPDGLRLLQDAVRGQTDELLSRFGTRREELSRLFVAGNTIMQHLYAGLDPSPITRAPYRPAVFFTGDEPRESGVDYAPCVSGYVGGDIMAGLLASGLWEREERSLYLDVGTNGEMALGGRDGFVCCAVASGPAFEGAGISCGMPAADGAVCHVSWGAEGPRCEVIGGGEARGLCGSGLIDLLALLCEKRIVSATGRLLGPDEAPDACRPWLEEDENGNGVFCLTPDRRLYLTAGDVRQLQLAKAAVAAGIRVLLKRSGLSAAGLDRLYLAGGFGVTVDPRGAAAIGMLPEELIERIVPLGNASLTGARRALLDSAARERLLKIRESCRYIELSGDSDFNEEYPEQMFFYEEDEEEWN